MDPVPDPEGPKSTGSATLLAAVVHSDLRPLGSDCRSGTRRPRPAVYRSIAWLKSPSIFNIYRVSVKGILIKLKNDRKNGNGWYLPVRSVTAKYSFMPSKSTVNKKKIGASECF